MVWCTVQYSTVLIVSTEVRLQSICSHLYDEMVIIVT